MKVRVGGMFRVGGKVGGRVKGLGVRVRLGLKLRVRVC